MKRYNGSKVWLLAPDENWIVDRFVREFKRDNEDIVVEFPVDAKVLWFIAGWCWEKKDLAGGRLIERAHREGKKIIVSEHHVVPNKFNEKEFILRDQYTTAYHVPNAHTEAFIRSLTQKPIHVIPYWAENGIWVKNGVQGDLRKKHGLPVDGYLVGSFQRDTEGADGRADALYNMIRSQGKSLKDLDLKFWTPKLEKGPDLFCDFLEHVWSTEKRLHVVLAGWRRQYVISRLEKAGIPYTYFELPSQDVVNELYQTLDLYPVTARYEGGPQSLIECGILGVPVVSRDVGMASQLLPSHAIADDVTLAVPAVPTIEHLKLPQGYGAYRKLFEEA